MLIGNVESGLYLSPKNPEYDLLEKAKNFQHSDAADYVVCIVTLTVWMSSDLRDDRHPTVDIRAYE